MEKKTMITDGYKGVLLEFFGTYDNDRILNIHPLQLNAAILLFNRRAETEIKFDGHSGPESILVIDHDGHVAAAYELKAKPTSWQHAVLYPDGTFWTGPVLEGEEANVDYMILTVPALSLLKKPDGFSFHHQDGDRRPTVLAKFSDQVMSLCGGHRCARCQKFDKLIVNGIGSRSGARSR